MYVPHTRPATRKFFYVCEKIFKYIEGVRLYIRTWLAPVERGTSLCTHFSPSELWPPPTLSASDHLLHSSPEQQQNQQRANLTHAMAILVRRFRQVSGSGNIIFPRPFLLYMEWSLCMLDMQKDWSERSCEEHTQGEMAAVFLLQLPAHIIHTDFISAIMSRPTWYLICTSASLSWVVFSFSSSSSLRSLFTSPSRAAVLAERPSLSVCTATSSVSAALLSLGQRY